MARPNRKYDAEYNGILDQYLADYNLEDEDVEYYEIDSEIFLDEKRNNVKIWFKKECENVN